MSTFCLDGTSVQPCFKYDGAINSKH